MARRAMAVLTLGILAILPATARASSLELRIGAFFPRADSLLFHDDSVLYTVSKSDWTGVYGGAEFSIAPKPHIEVGFSLDGYGQTVHTSYRDYTRPDGTEILQSLKLTLVPLGVTVRFLPLDQYATVSPYIGVGPDLIFYQYEEFRGLHRLPSPGLDIRGDHFQSDGAHPGLHVTGGLRLRIGHDFSLLGEGRYQWGEVDLGEDFRAQPGQAPLRLDMSGWSVVGGLSIRF